MCFQFNFLSVRGKLCYFVFQTFHRLAALSANCIFFAFLLQYLKVWHCLFTFPEGYTSPQGDHSPSLLVSPSMPISSCPLSSVPTSTQAKPHLLTPLSGRDQPQARLKLARECPQSTKPSNGSLSMGRTRLPQKQPSPVPSLSSAKQKRVSRRRATNGWRPVGMPTEKEVFIAVGYVWVKMSKRLVWLSVWWDFFSCIPDNTLLVENLASSQLPGRQRIKSALGGKR